WFESDGSGSFTEHLVSDHAKVAAIPIDMDGDGDLDIVSFGDRLTLFYNDGNGGFANSLELGWGWDLGYYNPKELSIIDIDGDSDVDIVASYMNGVALFMQDSGNLLGAISIYSGSSINNSLPIQMNDDNHWDIIVSEHDPYHIDNDNDLFWLEGDGNNSWEIEHGITELLRLSLNTSQHGAVFGEILNSWLDYHYNYFDLAINDDLLPLSFALHQNYPNPFNPTTTLQYDLPEDAKVKIMIYDLMGRQVKTLVNNQQSAGFKSIIWGATNDLGQPVSAGMYLYRISAGDFHSVKKMILLK
ncbi:MAG: T9SS type A sorting domain-containing protein, partial [Candidatus Marinimicrobia bacterium]|nr:T9SS type A sorting domain-containing protein [Candidatus Neomarinimicrobiota bacterium]